MGMEVELDALHHGGVVALEKQIDIRHTPRVADRQGGGVDKDDVGIRWINRSSRSEIDVSK